MSDKININIKVIKLKNVYNAIKMIGTCHN